MTTVTLGIDLGKSVFHIVGQDVAGAILLRRRLSRPQLVTLTANLPACRVGMEACCGAHYLGRILARQGHDVRLMPAQYVRPFVKSHKNDYIDAEAIAEAVQRPSMHFVPLKSEVQLDQQALHRVRDRLVRRRTATINQIRAFMLERGVTVAQRRRNLERALPTILADESVQLSPRVRLLLAELREEWRDLDGRIEALTDEIGAAAKVDPACQRLMTIPGVGPMIASALVAAVGDGSAFARGRDLAAWLGLVPHQHSTGGKTRLLGISKRGNSYLRRLLIHGARAAIGHLAKKPTPLGRWVADLLTRVHGNVAVVALANKLARIAWAVLRGDKPFETIHRQAAAA
jgi:transposase